MLGLKVLPTDKDGGFALEHGDVLAKVTDEVMKSVFYEEIPPNLNQQAYLSYANDIITDIAKFEKQKGLIKELLKPMRSCGSSLISKLKLTVKTHKPPGSVGHRNSRQLCYERVKHMGYG